MQEGRKEGGREGYQTKIGKKYIPEKKPWETEEKFHNKSFAYKT